MANARLARRTVLAADIGGTKTRLGLFAEHGVSPIASETYRTAEFAGAAEMIESFLAPLGAGSSSRPIPVSVVLNADAALIGAALFAQDAAPIERLLAA